MTGRQRPEQPITCDAARSDTLTPSAKLRAPADGDCGLRLPRVSHLRSTHRLDPRGNTPRSIYSRVGSFRDALETLASWLSAPIILLCAPPFYAWRRWRRARYEHLRRRAHACSQAELLELVTRPPMRLWELYYPGGFASNDELTEQLLVVHSRERRLLVIDVLDYKLAQTLRERGHSIRVTLVPEHEGILEWLALVGVVVWVGVGLVVRELL